MRTWIPGSVLVMAGVLHAAIVGNLAPDAISRATTYHTHSGDVAALVDGLVPPDPAPSFVWNTQGVITFAWADPVALAAVRLRIGTVANDYGVRAFLGGHLLDEGTTRDPEGELTAQVVDVSRVVDDWLRISMPAGTHADNLELHCLGPVELYEVEILTADPTVITPMSWAGVKAKTQPFTATSVRPRSFSAD